MDFERDQLSEAKAKDAGLQVKNVQDAVSNADVVMILAPDEYQADLYKDSIEPNLKSSAAIAFAHGFNIHYKQIQPASTHDVFMIAPKSPGHLVRSTFVSWQRCSYFDSSS